MRTTLTKRAVDAFQPADTAWIAWDDKLTGFGLRIHPAGTKSFIVNYRAGDGGRKAPNKRVTIGRYGRVTVDQARKLAQNLLGKVAGGADPAYERAMARAMPTLGDAFEEYMAVNPNRSKRTNELYRYEANRYLGDWLTRPLDSHHPPGCRDPLQQHHRGPRMVAGQPGDVPVCGRSIAGPASITTGSAIRSISGLPAAASSTARRGARSPARRKCCRAGAPASRRRSTTPPSGMRYLFGLYTGMRREEVLTLRWERVDMDARTFRVEHTKTGVPLELPITRQLAAILERRLAETGDYPAHVRDWVFPSPTSATGHVQDPHHLYARISESGGAKFWFHGLRNCFITVAERELMLPLLADQTAGQPRPAQ